LKKTAALTETQMDAWYGVLNQFSARIINKAVLQLCLTEVRFPEIGDLYQLCRAEAIRRGLITLPYSPYGDANDKKQLPTSAELEVIGKQLGLDV
jgi:hypothetical protein